MVTVPLISKIQKYSTKDGPGIRTTVFFLGCNLKCLWCSNPELMTSDQKVLHYRNKCQRCGYCVSLSNGTITLVDGEIIIDRANCRNLAEIAESCPFEAYEVAGKQYTADALAELLLRDEIFYKKSGGGVTFSGGEAALYPDYLLAVAKILKKNDIHLTLDTAGLWDYEKLAPLIEYIDLFLFDVKAYDERLHKKVTGVANGTILANLRKLSVTGKRIFMRLVLVPGQNDDWEDLEKRLALAKELNIEQVDILYYHKLGLGKYQGLNIDYPLSATSLCEEDYKKKVERLVKDYDLTATFSE